MIQDNPPKRRNIKGSVAIQAIKSKGGTDWLRLVWSYRGKRYFLSLGLDDNPLNRLVAESLANQIKGDMATANFDPTLAKYKSPAVEPKPKTASLKEVIDAFLNFKRGQIESETFETYLNYLPKIDEFFNGKIVTEGTAFEFKDWLLERNQPITARSKIVFLNACYELALKRKQVEENPFKDIEVKVPPKQRVKPFAVSEIKKIIEGFESSPHYRAYTPYVKFLLGVGCRLGEANGLQWKHVADDFSEIVICCKLTQKNERKTTKTNRDRIIPLPPVLQDVLRDIRPPNPNPESPVFISPQGGLIKPQSFRCAWVVVLKKMGVPYRKPGNTRHTLISHGLAQGKSPAEMAEIAGNRIDTIYKYYAGSVIHRPSLPVLLPEDDDI